MGNANEPHRSQTDTMDTKAKQTTLRLHSLQKLLINLSSSQILHLKRSSNAKIITKGQCYRRETRIIKPVELIRLFRIESFGKKPKFISM